MHIPSHILKPEVAVVSAAISVSVLAYAAAKIQSSSFLRSRIPALAAASVAILGLQAINLAIPGGTSVHILGGALLAIGFGPWLGVLGMAAVFLVQATLLGDGGLDALGANWLNGAIAAPLVGYAAYRALAGHSPIRETAGVFLGGMGSLLVAATLCSFQLSLSGAASFETIAASMVRGSAIWGFAEGALSAVLFLGFQSRVLASLSPKTGVLSLLALGALSLGLHPVVTSKQPDVLDRTISKISPSRL